MAEEGNTLIVADYGQLELRLMAHITGCKSMIDAFESGGCFHSRTAVGMYDYIKKAVDDGKVLLEWDYGKGQPTCPLVKDTYASERRKAKTLNFSIAYGKTVHGLAADWGITIDEAQETLEAWYRDRPEVREWQDRTRERAKAMGSVRTLMGRYRDLPDAMKLDMANKAANAHALRAAINAPIQVSLRVIMLTVTIILMIFFFSLWCFPIHFFGAFVLRCCIVLFCVVTSLGKRCGRSYDGDDQTVEEREEWPFEGAGMETAPPDSR